MERLYAVGTTTRRESYRQAKCAVERKELKALKTLMKKTTARAYTRGTEWRTNKQPGQIPLAPPTLATLTQNKGTCCAWHKDGLPCVEPEGTTTRVAPTQKSRERKSPTQACEAPEHNVMSDADSAVQPFYVVILGTVAGVVVGDCRGRQCVDLRVQSWCGDHGSDHCEGSRALKASSLPSTWPKGGVDELAV